MDIPFLQAGDKVAITASASKVNRDHVLEGVKYLKDWGFEVVIGDSVGRSHFNFSDTFENRKSELQGGLDDPSIKCILAARGGYGTSNLIDTLDFSRFLTSPKWIVGFSDLTSLLLHVNRLGYPAVHGPMAKTLVFDEFSRENLRKILTGESTAYEWASSPRNKTGNVSGLTVGGNLVLLAHSIGSQSDLSYDGKILLIEDVGEKLYSVDRLMVQLKRAGKLSKLAGLIVGDFSNNEEALDTFGSSIPDIVLNHTADFDYPIAFDFKFGHEDVNLPIVMGSMYHLSVQSSGVTLKSNFNGIV
jgi:muramoyltetrapeptide carboxypeptidase